MNIVNITDIEDLIISKYKIDQLLIEKEEQEGRSQLNDFMNKYATLDYVYLIEGKQIPFKYVKVYDDEYLFVSNADEESINIIKTKLKLLKYDLNNLVELSRLELAHKIELNHIIVHGDKYFM